MLSVKYNLRVSNEPAPPVDTRRIGSSAVDSFQPETTDHDGSSSVSESESCGSSDTSEMDATSSLFNAVYDTTYEWGGLLPWPLSDIEEDVPEELVPRISVAILSTLCKTEWFQQLCVYRCDLSTHTLSPAWKTHDCGLSGRHLFRATSFPELVAFLLLLH